MFADALLDSHHQSRRGWATLTSFGAQAIAVAFLLIVPLFYTQVLPRWEPLTHVVAPPLGDVSVPQPKPVQAAGRATSIFTTANNALITPRQVPHTIDLGPEVSAPEVTIGPGGPWHMGPGSPDGVLHGMDQVLTRVLPPRTVTVVQPRVSVMMEGSLIHKVEPTYPAPARAIRAQGSVVLAAVIGTDGSVQKLQVLSGHPLLVQAAKNAVSQWRYRPYILNGAPIEVDTQITVNFILAR